MGNRIQRKKFSEMWRVEEDYSIPEFWQASWEKSPFYDEYITPIDMTWIFWRLYTKYYNDYYIYKDNIGILNGTFKHIADYYPNLKDRLSLLEGYRDMDITDFARGGVSLNSQGANPKTATGMLTQIDLVDSQAVSTNTASDNDAMAMKYNSMIDGLQEEFVGRFKHLFAYLYTPTYGYFYTND